MIEKLHALILRLQLMAVMAVMTTIVTVASFGRKRRMSHENGIAARGRVRIVDEPTFPANDFFQPGREFDCRIRHGSVLFKDDAKMTVRSASLKFADSQFESPFDMLMNTGRVGLFWNARSFFDFGMMTGKHGKHFVPYLQKYPQSVYGGGDSSRRNPASFAGMSFNSQTCYEFIATDGTRYYCRYRLIPVQGWSDDVPETGALSQWWRDHNWLQNPYPDEERTRNYLKDEYRARLEGDGTANYRFQIQLRQPPPGHEPEWTTAEYEWFEDVTPWHDLASVTITEALDYNESMLTWFDLGNHPQSLPVPMGVSIDDPHSLNNLRMAAKWAGKARLLSYRLRGMPAEFGDSRDDPEWEQIPPMPVPPPAPALAAATR
jgi:arachidonate 5-lipoxygenase